MNLEWKELKVNADLAELGRVRALLQERLQGLSLTEEEAMKLELALHEIFVNIAMHAYPDGKGQVTIRIRNDAAAFYMEIRDRGIPFNPDEIPPPDLEEKIRLRTRGGLGIYLFKTLMDGYTYTRDGSENVLRIHLALGSAATLHD